MERPGGDCAGACWKAYDILLCRFISMLVTSVVLVTLTLEYPPEPAGY